MTQNEEKEPRFETLEPWEDIIICEDAPEERTQEGIYLPSSDGGDTPIDPNKRPEKGIVMAVGKLSDAKKKLPVDIRPGDMIFYERYTANKIPDQGKMRNFIRLKFIVGVKKKV